MRRTLLLAVAFAAAISVPGRPAASADAPYTDDACPQANGPARRLHELNQLAQPSNDDLVAAAQGLVDAYKDCAASFDRDQNGHNADTSSDYVVTYRMYMQLQIARSLRRTGSFADQLHDPNKARTDYTAALEALDKVEQIAGSAHRGPSEGNEGKLLSECRSLRDQLSSAVKALPAASPSPMPSR